MTTTAIRAKLSILKSLPLPPAAVRQSPSFPSITAAIRLLCLVRGRRSAFGAGVTFSAQLAAAARRQPLPDARDIAPRVAAEPAQARHQVADGILVRRLQGAELIPG